MQPHFTPTSLVWDDRRYVVAGNSLLNDGNVALAVFTIDASGVIGELHVVRPPVNGDTPFNPMLAWSGTGYLMSFIQVQPPCENCYVRGPAHAMPLTASLESGTEISIGRLVEVTSTAVAWNGGEFLVAAINYSIPEMTRVSLDGRSIGTVRVKRPDLSDSLGRPSIVTDGTDFLVVCKGDTNPYNTGPVNNYQIAVHADGSTSDLTVIDRALMTSDLLLLKAAGRQLLVSARPVEAEPYYGASRVTVQTTDAVTIGAAPSLTFAFDASLATLRWTAVPNAAEYRIEYRESGDAWRELDLSQGLNTSLSVRLKSNTKLFEFRVRGWSASGASPYSNTIPLVLPRRRAA